MSIFKNGEGYADPTAGTALKHIDYQERLKEIKRKISNLDNRKEKQVSVRKMILLTHQNTHISERYLHKTDHNSFVTHYSLI